MWSPGQPELPAGSPLAAHTFTDAELQSLIVGLDNRRPDLDSLLGGLQGVPSLQFLPHLPEDAAAASARQQAEAMPPPQPALFVPADLSGSGPALPLPPALELPLPSSSLGTSEEGMAWDDSGPQEPQPQPQSRPQRPQRRQQQQQQQQQQHAARAGRATGQRGRPPPPAKQPHSQVEKQRRDRINSLIDELRELVPPQSSESAAATSALDGAASDGRRPKHTVLMDTIRLIKDLQLQLAETHAGPEGGGAPGGSNSGDAELLWQDPQLPQAAAAAHEPLHGQQQQQQQQQQQHSSGEGGHLHPELPHAPEDEPAAQAGVVVELEDGAIRYVKVTCPDRHGLLADIVRALKELPLEITTAAITTRRDHICVDTFQVEVEDPALRPEDISALIEEALRLPGDKKRKADAAGT